jgi:hypothetical protein
MRRFALLLSLVTAASPALAASPTETVAQFHAALAAGKVEQASALLSPSIQIYESGYVERSRDEYVGHHLKSDIEFAKATRSKVLQHSERIDGKLALVMQESETSGTFKGKPVHLFGTETALLEQQGDNWVIVHIHWSSRKGK